MVPPRRARSRSPRAVRHGPPLPSPPAASPRPASLEPGHGSAPPAARGERRGEGARPDVLLAWALDREGRKVHAGKLDPRARRARSPFSCLGCGEPLVPRLGRIRAHHFAHRPGSACPLTAPESVLHLDAKERLLALCEDAFQGRRAVVVLARCPACRRLTPRDLAAEGDAAVAEGAVGSLRADVLVLRAGRPALAIEVKVTHAVEPEKEAALAAAAVPAVEVDAREEWEEPGADGAVAIGCARSLGFAPCPACAARERADRERAEGGEAAAIAELEAYRARGLLGPPPGPLAEVADRPFTAAERAALIGRFRCPECGQGELIAGERLLRHACPLQGVRPVAWRGYDGAVVELSWWRR